MSLGSSISCSELVKSQLEFFNSNETKSVEFRVSQLKKIKHILKDNQSLLDEAIYKDFKKSSFDTYATELSVIHHEINLCMENLHDWASRKRVDSNLATFPSNSFLIPEPLGVTLVIGAWNYPYLLTLNPLISAIAAGNTVVVKPSEITSNCSTLIANLINSNFNSNYIHVIEGAEEVTTQLLREKFDKIFFTGSTQVGKIIMRAASEHLTPVTLELGGKSPAFIFNDAKISIAAKRIVWGKFINGGQTCVAPDYLLVEKGIKPTLISALKQEIEKTYGKDPQQSEALVRIINKKHFHRVSNLIEADKVIIGGETDETDLFIAPTVMDGITYNDKIMEDEIFGPVLPIIEFDDLDWAIRMVKIRPKPLALYTFSSNSKTRDKILDEISFGGGVVNDTVMHLANSNLPFGGVGNSGMGSYHGKFGFDTFSHYKGILNKSNLFEPTIKYAPYSNWKKKLLKLFME